MSVFHALPKKTLLAAVVATASAFYVVNSTSTAPLTTSTTQGQSSVPQTISETKFSTFCSPIPPQARSAVYLNNPSCSQPGQPSSQ